MDLIDIILIPKTRQEKSELGIAQTDRLKTC